MPYVNPDVLRQPAVESLTGKLQDQSRSKLEAYLKGQQMEKQQELSQQNQEYNIQQAQDLKDKLEAGGKGTKYNIGLSAGGGVSIGQSESDPLTNYLKMFQVQNLQDERKRKAIQDVEDRATKANTAQIVPALQRGEEAIPGLFTDQAKQPELKSVGGLKNLIPNVLVPPAESLGLLDKGAAKERTALQELSNAKIYDSSGKQINESEMKRIQTALGLNGVFSQEEIIPALRQMGYTAFEKQKQVSAGADPRALEEFKSRGGLAGYQSIKDLVNRPKEGNTQDPNISNYAKQYNLPYDKAETILRARGYGK